MSTLSSLSHPPLQPQIVTGGVQELESHEMITGRLSLHLTFGLPHHQERYAFQGRCGFESCLPLQSLTDSPPLCIQAEVEVIS